MFKNYPAAENDGGHILQSSVTPRPTFLMEDPNHADKSELFIAILCICF